MYAINRYNLTKVRLLHLLEELKAENVTTGSLCLKPGTMKNKIESSLETALDINTVPVEMTTALAESPTGGMVFWGPNHWYLVMPPFPVNEERFANSCEIEPLYTILHKDFVLGLVLIRLGQYAIGVFEGEKLVASKTGTGLVHARHRQGGSSSHRFERHREKQMETFFTQVCGHAREQLEPYAGKLEYILYGGTKETVAEFRKQCHFLQVFDKRTLNRLLNIREPKHSGLEEGIQEAWSSKVVQWDG